MRKFFVVIRWFGISLLVFSLLVAGILFIPVLSDPASGFIARKGELQRVEVNRQWQTATTVFTDIKLTSSSGLQAQLIVSRPRQVSTPRPTVILMGGYQTGRHAVELIRDTHGLVAASIDYPYHGKPATDGFGLFRNVGAVRQALVDTPPVVLLTLDYLVRQDYVDASRIELAGVSFGAFLAAIPGALDTRIKRVWLIHGSGDPPAVFDHLTSNKIRFKPLRWLLTRTFAILIQSQYLKPERWVGRISPRSVMVVHARNDPSFPKESLVSLHQALHQPYKIIWVGEEHIGVRSQELIQAITDLIVRNISPARQTPEAITPERSD